MNKIEQMYYTSFIVAIIHAFFAVFGAVFCFLYADGEKNTTWLHDNYFKMHMFDIQKYLHVFSAGFMLLDTIFCFIAANQSTSLT